MNTHNTYIPVLTMLVTYNGAEILPETMPGFFKLWELPGHFLVVDNASTDSTLEVLRSLNHPNLVIKQFPHNLGLGAAYNLGLEYASTLGLKWMLILDQDSFCDPLMGERLFNDALRLEKGNHKPAAVCPTVQSFFFPEIFHHPVRWTGRSFEAVMEHDSPQIVQVDSCISSGTLYSVNTLLKVGGFDESLFIDCIDHECHLRLGSKGWKIFWSKNSRILQRLGKKQMLTPRGLLIIHEPLRYYYISRNMTLLYFRFGGVISVFILGRICFKQIFELALNRQSWLKELGFMIRGFAHALIRRSGTINSKQRFKEVKKSTNNDSDILEKESHLKYLSSLARDSKTVIFVSSSGHCTLNCGYCIVDPIAKREPSLNKSDFEYLLSSLKGKAFLAFSGKGDFFAGYSASQRLLEIILGFDVEIALDINGVIIHELPEIKLPLFSKIRMINLTLHYRQVLRSGLNKWAENTRIIIERSKEANTYLLLGTIISPQDTDIHHRLFEDYSRHIHSLTGKKIILIKDILNPFPDGQEDYLHALHLKYQDIVDYVYEENLHQQFGDGQKVYCPAGVEYFRLWNTGKLQGCPYIPALADLGNIKNKSVKTLGSHTACTSPIYCDCNFIGYMDRMKTMFFDK